MSRRKSDMKKITILLWVSTLMVSLLTVCAVSLGATLKISLMAIFSLVLSLVATMMYKLEV